MRIREITKHSIREGALGNIGRGFVQGVTGVDFPRQSQSDDSDSDDSALQRATQKRAKQLAQQWAQHIKTQQTPQPATAPVNEPAATAEPVQPTMTRDQISQWISRNSQDPAALKAALDAINAQAEPGATNSNLKEAIPKVKPITRPVGGLAARSAQRNAPATTAPPTVDFERWADQQLTTQISGTGQKIDLDAVKKDPATKAELDKVLPQIKKDPNNLAAVEQYFLYAMKGMQRMADAVKQKLAGNG